MSSIPLPGSTFTFSIPLVSQASSHVFQAAPTIAAGDFKRSINNGAFANMDNLPTVTPAAGKLVQIVVSASETTAAGEGGTIDIVGSDAAGAEWDDISICLRVGVIAANAAQLSGDAGAADNLELFFDGTGYASAGSINSVLETVSANLVQINGDADLPGNLAMTGAGSDTLKSLSDQLDLIGGSLGLYTDTITVRVSGLLVDGALVQVATDSLFANIVRSGYTNSLGQVTFQYDSVGTYYGRAELAGYNIATFTITVSA